VLVTVATHLMATHLVEEPSALEEVARLAREWFEVHLLSAEACATGVTTS